MSGSSDSRELRMKSSASVGQSLPRLKRALGLRDLVLYGVIIIQPVAPMSVFGVLSQRGHGHVVTTILIALVAMLFTAISYGRMARAYPNAGSAFNYVGQEIHPGLGYVTGWSMVLDYLLNPMICIIWISQQAHVLVPSVPYSLWAVCVAGAYTLLNIQGVKTSARVNAALTACMGMVIVLFFWAAARYILGYPREPGFFTLPFYDPASWSIAAVLGGTSVAVLSFIGFDGISTLAEETENPRRNIPLATVLTCVVIGLLSALEVYAAQLVWPASEPYPNVDTAFTFVAARAWPPLLAVVGLTLIVANFGSGMSAHLGLSRLLYAMGRSRALPPSFFGVVDARRSIPRNNVILVGAVALAGAFLLPVIAGTATGFELGVNLLNFGALLAFMGVNAAAFVRYFVRADRKTALNFVLPLLGFAICLLLWWNLSHRAKFFGALWMSVGLALLVLKTRGFRREVMNFDLHAGEADEKAQLPR
jgi:putrescine importer